MMTLASTVAPAGTAQWSTSATAEPMPTHTRQARPSATPRQGAPLVKSRTVAIERPAPPLADVPGLPRTMAGDESIAFSPPNCREEYDAFHYQINRYYRPASRKPSAPWSGLPPGCEPRPDCGGEAVDRVADVEDDHAQHDQAHVEPLPALDHQPADAGAMRQRQFAG